MDERFAELIRAQLEKSMQTILTEMMADSQTILTEMMADSQLVYKRLSQKALEEVASMDADEITRRAAEIRERLNEGGN